MSPSSASRNILKVFLLGLFSAVALNLGSCVSDKGTGGTGGGGDETGTEIHLVGRVVDKDHAGIAGVRVVSVRTGLSDTTDALGGYDIQGNLGSDALARVTATGGAGWTHVALEDVDTLVFTQNTLTIATLPVSKWVEDLPEIRIIQRDISGALTSGIFSIGKVEAVIAGEGIPVDHPVVIEVFYSDIANRYSGFAYFQGTSTLTNYRVYVNVYDTTGRFIARSATLPFNSNAGSLVMPAFEAGNALPKPFAGADTSVGVAKLLQLHGTAVDSFGGTIARWEWKIGGSGFVRTSTGDTTVVMPSARTSGYLCILRVTDNDSNVSTDTLRVEVVNANPVVSGMRDTTISVGDSVRFAISASDAEGIRRYLWDMDADGVYEDTTTSASHGRRYPLSSGVFRSVVRVEDLYDGFALDTAVVTVVLDKPVSGIQGSSTVKVGAPILFTAQATQQYGSIAMYKWDDGKSPGWDDSSATLSQFTATYTATGTYTVRLLVRDDDGNRDSATKVVTVTNDDPVISPRLKDTTVSVKDSVIFTVSATDPEGIKWYVWDYGADGLYLDTVTSNRKAYLMGAAPGMVQVAVAVYDNYRGVTRNTAVVKTVLDGPVPSILGDSTVKIGVALGLSAQVTQQFGSVTMYKWDDGKSPGWDDSSATMTQASFTYQTAGTYAARLYVRDDDGNLDSVSRNITVWANDPLTWTAQSSGIATDLNTVEWSGSYFVAAGPGKIMSSPDGVTWALQHGVPTTDSTYGSYNTIYATGSTVMAFGVQKSNGTADKQPAYLSLTIGSSTKSIPFMPYIWSLVKYNISSVASGSGQLVAVGPNVNIYESNGAVKPEYREVILTRTTGSWTAQKPGHGCSLSSIVWTGAQFVAVGKDDQADGAVTFTTPNGVDWVKRSWTPESPNAKWSSVAWNGNQLVAVGNNPDLGIILSATSTDGINWTVRNTGFNGTTSKIIWAGSQFVILASSNQILTSPDGVAWASRGSAPTGTLKSIAWNGSKVVIVGAGGLVYTSSP